MEREDHLTNPQRLQELGGSDFEIADNQPNIKGWTVKNEQGQTIGEVDELIFDPQSRKVRYMVVDMEGSVLDLDPRDVLVPIGIAELHESDDDVILPQVTAEQLRALPTYRKGEIDRHTESSIRYVFEYMGAAGLAAGTTAGAAALNTPSASASAPAPTDQEDFYAHQHFQEDNLMRNRVPRPAPDPMPADATRTEGSVIPIIEESVEVGTRQVETGGAHIHSRVVERPVEEHVRLREEHVHVERTPVDRPVTDADLNTFQEGVIELTEHAEVPVVNKEARVVEEVSLSKEVEEREEVVRDTARSTEVEIDRLDQNPDLNSTRPDLDRDRPDLDNDPRPAR